MYSEWIKQGKSVLILTFCLVVNGTYFYVTDAYYLHEYDYTAFAVDDCFTESVQEEDSVTLCISSQSPESWGRDCTVDLKAKVVEG